MKNLGMYLAAGAAVVMAGPAVAQTVADASFETPTVSTSSSPNYGTVAPGVTFTSGAGIEPNGGAFQYAAAPDGNQIAFLQGNATGFGVISQSITNLLSGRSYDVVFSTAARTGYAVLPITVGFGDQTLGTITPSSTAFTDTAPLTFIAGGNSGQLTFSGQITPGDYNAAIDNVRVSLVGSVPEPATWAMMLLGFGMIGFGLRYRRSGTTARVA